MKVATGVAPQRDDRGDYGLLVRLQGDTELESIFLSHLQVGHTVEFFDSASYGHGELQLILHNEEAEKSAKPVTRRRRNRK